MCDDYTRDYTRLEAFLNDETKTIYAEPPVASHTELTQRQVARMFKSYFKSGDKVLDIGCGQGVAREEFLRRGASWLGITMGADFSVCCDKKYEVAEMDQSFMFFDEAEFDILWARHILEHSIFPVFTLKEYLRILRPGGVAYVELPTAGPPRFHEQNRNHYCIMPEAAWRERFVHAGFNIVESELINAIDGDVFFWALLRKPL